MLLCVLLKLGTSQFHPYFSGLLHWHWGNHMIAPMPVNQPWRIWVTQSHISTEHYTKTKQNKEQQNQVHILWDIVYMLCQYISIHNGAQDWCQYSVPIPFYDVITKWVGHPQNFGTKLCHVSEQLWYCCQISDLFAFCTVNMLLISLKTDSCHDAKSVVTGGMAGCCYDNLQCHQ